ncbi:MAG: hypothetical protein AAF742_03540 [Pseudomonadota bacterium]
MGDVSLGGEKASELSKNEHVVSSETLLRGIWDSLSLIATFVAASVTLVMAALIVPLAVSAFGLFSDQKRRLSAKRWRPIRGAGV